MLVHRFKPAHAAGLIAVLTACSSALLIAAPLAAQAQSTTTTASAITPMSKAQPQGTVAFDIPAQDLSAALTEFARQSGQELIYNPASAAGKVGNAVEGEMSRANAMQQLLKGTGLEFLIMPSGGMMLGDPEAVSSYRAKMQTSSASEATGIASDVVAQAPVDPALTDPGVATEPTTESVTSAKRGGIEEVIVTARRRAESVENIPISITALSAEDLKAFGVRNFADLEGVVPGLNLGGGGNGVKKDSSPFIRGVGQRETKVTLDPAVATYIDGIYIGRAAGAMLDITDVESVQVLRGPQGTLFGRNATGGAISVSLKKPKNDWGVSLGTNIGNYHRREFSLMVNAPLIDDTLLGRVFISTANSQGYFTNVVDGEDWGGDNRVTGIAQLRYLPTDSLTIDVLGERTHIRETPRPQRCSYMQPSGSFTTAQLFLLDNDLLFSGAFDVDGYKRHEGLCRQSMALKSNQFASDLTDSMDSLLPKGRYWVDTSTAGLTANWDVGDFGPFSGISVKSISAWRETKQIADEDLDAISDPNLVRIQPDFDETTQISEEIQLSARALNDRLFVSTGLYYFNEKTPRSDLILSAGIGGEQYVPGGITGSDLGEYIRVIVEPAKERLETDNDAYAWYAQLDFDVTPQVQITGGLRWTKESRWSRYSKTYAAPSSTADNFVYAYDLGSALQGIGYSEPGSFRSALEWTYAAREYYYVGPEPGPHGERLVPNYFVGDELSMNNDAWTPMASFKYKANNEMLENLGLDQAMGYVTYSQGFHSGGVTAGAIDEDEWFITAGTNDPAVSGVPCDPSVYVAPDGTCGSFFIPELGYGTADPITFKPERVANYEVGLKISALDRRLQSNLALFYMDYTDMQTTAVGSRFGIPVPYIENVGKSVIRGIEAELVAMPLPQWRIFLNGSYTDADIKKWTSTTVVLESDGTVYVAVPSHDVDRSDERMPRVPRLQLFGSTECSFDFGSAGTLTPSIGVRYVSSIYHGFDRGSWIYSYGGYRYNHGGMLPPHANNPEWNNDFGEDPYINPDPSAKWETTSRPVTFVDARIAWVSANGRMEVAAWGKNLTNVDDYLVGGIPLVDVTGAVGQVYANPRTFGLNLNYSFGAQ